VAAAEMNVGDPDGSIFHSSWKSDNEACGD
jgi:hypothetical protein